MAKFVKKEGDLKTNFTKVSNDFIDNLHKIKPTDIVLYLYLCSLNNVNVDWKSFNVKYGYTKQAFYKSLKSLSDLGLLSFDEKSITINSKHTFTNDEENSKQMITDSKHTFTNDEENSKQMITDSKQMITDSKHTFTDSKHTFTPNTIEKPLQPLETLPIQKVEENDNKTSIYKTSINKISLDKKRNNKNSINKENFENLFFSDENSNLYPIPKFYHEIAFEFYKSQFDENSKQIQRNIFYENPNFETYFNSEKNSKNITKIVLSSNDNSLNEKPIKEEIKTEEPIKKIFLVNKENTKFYEIPDELQEQASIVYHFILTQPKKEELHKILKQNKEFTIFFQKYSKFNNIGIFDYFYKNEIQEKIYKLEEPNV